MLSLPVPRILPVVGRSDVTSIRATNLPGTEDKSMPDIAESVPLAAGDRPIPSAEPPTAYIRDVSTPNPELPHARGAQSTKFLHLCQDTRIGNWRLKLFFLAVKDFAKVFEDSDTGRAKVYIKTLCRVTEKAPGRIERRRSGPTGAVRRRSTREGNVPRLAPPAGRGADVDGRGAGMTIRRRALSDGPIGGGRNL